MRRLAKVVVIFLAVVLASAPAFAAQPVQKEILIGLIPEMNIFKQRQRYRHVADYLSEKTGLQVRLTTLARYGNILENFNSAGMDGAFFGSFTGALAIKRLDVEPIARPLWLDGRSTYHGHLFVRRDSGIRGVKDMRGKRMAFVERATTAGYIFPMAYLREHGVRDMGKFFSEYYFAGSHDSTISAVLNGEADVGCAKNTIMERVISENPRVAEELVTLVESPQVPSNGLLVRRSLEQEIKDRLRQALLGMHEDPGGRAVLVEFGAEKFIETTVGDYGPVYTAAAKAGIDIEKYDYSNVRP
jgi:phosphonate transport system substrate-binding protein